MQALRLQKAGVGRYLLRFVLGFGYGFVIVGLGISALLILRRSEAAARLQRRLVGGRTLRHLHLLEKVFRKRAVLKESKL